MFLEVSLVFCPGDGSFFEDSLSGFDSFVDAFNDDVEAFLRTIIDVLVGFVSR